MIRVLFICDGNICRSTLAQSFFTHLVNTHGLADQFVIDSCATSREEIGNPPHRGTVNKLREMGIIRRDRLPGSTIPILIISLVWILPTYAIFIVCSREIRIKKYPNY